MPDNQREARLSLPDVSIGAGDPIDLEKKFRERCFRLIGQVLAAPFADALLKSQEVNSYR